ncbi:unnamed protein product [Tenebrio molitor]|nr:unnamed protein product [Tenebrio molitor]
MENRIVTCQNKCPVCQNNLFVMKQSQNLCWSNDFAISDLVLNRKDKRSGKRPPPSRNPFLNFLRDFRKCNRNLGGSQLMKMGAELWRRMNEAQKLLYFELAKNAPKKQQQRGRKRKKRRRKRRVRFEDESSSRHSTPASD